MLNPILSTIIAPIDSGTRQHSETFWIFRPQKLGGKKSINENISATCFWLSHTVQHGYARRERGCEAAALTTRRWKQSCTPSSLWTHRRKAFVWWIAHVLQFSNSALRIWRVSIKPTLCVARCFSHLTKISSDSRMSWNWTWRTPKWSHFLQKNNFGGW